MKKIVFIYILMIILIALLAILMNFPFEAASSIKFSPSLHILLEGTNSLLMLSISIFSHYLYSKIKDERLVILGGGFFVGAIFNTIHILTIKSFPYDLLSLTNIQNNPSIVYLLFGNLIQPLAIYFALTHKPSEEKFQNFRCKIYSRYFSVILVLAIVPFLTSHLFPGSIGKFNMFVHSLEFINYSLYIMLAFIVINIRQSTKATFFPTFTTGLIISGLGGLFYINPALIQTNEILAHIFQGIGLVFILCGIQKMLTYSQYLRFKDELVANLSLTLIVFYIAFISIVAFLFHVSFPPVSAYIFVEFILVFQFIVYLVGNKITQPITDIIDKLNDYSPGKDFIDIPIVRHDELGLLTEKINFVSRLSWQKISELSRLVEREQSIIRVFESMRRVSNKNIIKNSIMDEIKKLFKPDKCFIALYDSSKDSFYFDKYFENLPSKVLLDFDTKNEDDLMIKKMNDFLKSDIELTFSNVEDYIVKNSLEGTKKEELLRGFHVKSWYNIPIYFSGKLIGCLVLHYTEEMRDIDKMELLYLKTMATQIGILEEANL